MYREMGMGSWLEKAEAALPRHLYVALREELCEPGWVEDQNMMIDARWAEGQLIGSLVGC
jgi:hypothetical protein